jgi:hypothetical protein
MNLTEDYRAAADTFAMMCLKNGQADAYHTFCAMIRKFGAVQYYRMTFEHSDLPQEVKDVILKASKYIEQQNPKYNERFLS